MGSRWLTKDLMTDSDSVLILFLLIVVLLLLLAPRDQVRPCAPQCGSANRLFRRQVFVAAPKRSLLGCHDPIRGGTLLRFPIPFHLGTARRWLRSSAFHPA